MASREYVRPEDVVHEPWIWVEGGDPKARAFWSLADYRGDKPLRTVRSGNSPRSDGSSSNERSGGW